MLDTLRLTLLVFVALVLLLLVGAMPAATPQQKRQRAFSYMLVLLAYIALVALYMSILPRH